MADELLENLVFMEGPIVDFVGVLLGGADDGGAVVGESNQVDFADLVVEGSDFPGWLEERITCP